MNEANEFLLRYISRHVPGAQWLIAGGYARDIALGAVPKDMDIIICGSDPAWLDDLPAPWFIDEVNEPSEMADEDVNDFDDRLSYVVQLEAEGGLSADLLFPLAPTPLEYVKLFDFNINQFVMTGHYDAGPVFVGKDYGRLVQLRNAKVSPERREYMEAKARAFGWEV